MCLVIVGGKLSLSILAVRYSAVEVETLNSSASCWPLHFSNSRKQSLIIVGDVFVDIASLGSVKYD